MTAASGLQGKNAVATGTRTAAEIAVGEDKPGSDWKLEPETHAGSLPPEAGALARILRRPEIVDIMQGYRRFDAEAEAQQKLFKGMRFRRNLVALLAAAFGVVALSIAVINQRQTELHWWFVIFHLLALGGTLFYVWSLDAKAPYRLWREARAKAEAHRVRLFEQVLEAREEPKAGELPSLPLQFHYFRRYQLGVQRRYFEGRGAQKSWITRIVKWWQWASLVLAALLAVCALPALLHLAAEQGVAWADRASTWLDQRTPERLGTWLLAGLAVSSVFALALISHDREAERDAARYKAAFGKLNWLETATWRDGATVEGHVRAAAEAGGEAGHKKVEAFVGIVHDLMRAEQQEWISLGGEPGTASQADLLIAESAMPRLRQLGSDDRPS